VNLIPPENPPQFSFFDIFSIFNQSSLNPISFYIKLITQFIKIIYPNGSKPFRLNQNRFPIIRNPFHQNKIHTTKHIVQVSFRAGLYKFRCRLHESVTQNMGLCEQCDHLVHSGSEQIISCTHRIRKNLHFHTRRYSSRRHR